MQSLAEKAAALPNRERQRLLEDLTLEEAEGLEFDWKFWGRPSQFEPIQRAWSTWLILAGRGYGKTRTGAETVRARMCGSTPLSGSRWRHVAIIAETAADARDVMVGEGKSGTEASGLLQIHPRAFRPVYVASKRRLEWPNGAIGSIFNATEPDQLRGPQFDGAWCDELAKWKYGQDTWDNLEFGLRTGDNPQIVITTTPKPIKLLREIIADPGTVITTGSTYENVANLAPKFLARMLTKYEGTRLGRQELRAEVLEDVQGALWSRANIEQSRIRPAALPSLVRVVVAIDPAMTSGDDADETGIVAAGLGADGHGYVLEDVSGIYAPVEWATEAIRIYVAKHADRVVAEINNGGEMVEATLRMVEPSVSYRAVHATRGKAMRAEPVSALYEQGRVHHVGTFSKLEDQMCSFTADFDRKQAGESPDRMDALVWALTELMVDSAPPLPISAKILARAGMRPGMRLR